MKAAIFELVLHTFASMGSSRIISQAGIFWGLTGDLFLNRALKVLNANWFLPLCPCFGSAFLLRTSLIWQLCALKKEGADLERYCKISPHRSMPDFRCCCITTKRTATKETNSQTTEIFTEIPGTLQISFQTSQPRERPFFHVSLQSNSINWTPASRT